MDLTTGHAAATPASRSTSGRAAAATPPQSEGPPPPADDNATTREDRKPLSSRPAIPADLLSAASFEQSGDSSSLDGRSSAKQRRGPLGRGGPPGPGGPPLRRPPPAPCSASSSPFFSAQRWAPQRAPGANELGSSSSSRSSSSSSAAAAKSGISPIACSSSLSSPIEPRGPPPRGVSFFLDKVDSLQHCLSFCLCVAAACSYHLLAAYSTPPPLHEFSVHFNYFPRVGLLLSSAGSSPGGPSPAQVQQTLHATAKEKQGPPKGQERLQPHLDALLRPEGPPDQERKATAGGPSSEEGGVPPSSPFAPWRWPPEEQGPHDFDGGHPGPSRPPPLGAHGLGGPLPGPGSGNESRGAPSYMHSAAPPQGGPPWAGGGRPSFGFSLSAPEFPLAVAVVPFSNRSWELLPGDAAMFAAPPLFLSSHWMQQEEQQQQQQLQEGEEPKLPAFDVDIVLSVSVPAATLSSSSSSCSAGLLPPIMVSLLLFSKEGAVVARSSRQLLLPAAAASVGSRLLAWLLPAALAADSAAVQLPLMELFPVSHLANLKFAAVYLYPPLPLGRASLLLLPKTHGIRLFLIRHPYLSFLLLTLLLLAAAAVTLCCCCCCCCGYFLAAAAAPEDKEGPLPRGGLGPPQMLFPLRGASREPLNRPQQPQQTPTSSSSSSNSSGSSVSTEQEQQQHAEEGQPLAAGGRPSSWGGPSAESPPSTLRLRAPWRRQSTRDRVL
ncbi:hypothetical protein Efla_005215 [Eimeria flavescens]